MQVVTRRESRPPPTPSSVFPHGNLLLMDNVFLVAHQGALSSQQTHTKRLPSKSLQVLHPQIQPNILEEKNPHLYWRHASYLPLMTPHTVQSVQRNSPALRAGAVFSAVWNLGGLQWMMDSQPKRGKQSGRTEGHRGNMSEKQILCFLLYVNPDFMYVFYTHTHTLGGKKGTSQRRRNRINRIKERGFGYEHNVQYMFIKCCNGVHYFGH